ncbi:hypothetical protein EDB80DRAFT_743580 [Ilyonectria destructans]|nr:hypothetical protein EDB80DRAFT_743580 [Ilyonectria destructans]
MFGTMAASLAKINKIDLPAIDETFLEGAPSTTLRDFKYPKLRQFPKRESQIQWLKFLGSGQEGMVFKVSIDDGDPVALKVFWRAKRPTQPSPKSPKPMILDWPFEDECITAALLEKMKWAMADDDTKVAAGANRTITVKKGPETAAEAIENLRAFSDEARQSSETRAKRPDRVPPFPSLPKCYGWTTVRRDELLPIPVVGVVDDVDWHWAIIYEFVPRTKQDTNIGQCHLDFFHAIGFALGPYKCDNWHGGRLIDLNDIRTPYGIGWTKSLVRHRDAEKWFSTLDSTQQFASTHKSLQAC